MALEAGVMSVCVEFAKDLKDTDWFGKQDPYCVIRVGGQTYRTKTAVDGGRNPVWNETFKFNIINENDGEIELKDSDVGKDDVLGTGTLSFTRARQTGSDRIQVPVVRKKSRKQQGFVSIALTWVPNKSLHQHSAAAPQYAPPAYPQAPPQQYAMPPAPYYPGAAHPPHGQPSGYYPPAGQFYPAGPPHAPLPPPYGAPQPMGYPATPVYR